MHKSKTTGIDIDSALLKHQLNNPSTTCYCFSESLVFMDNLPSLSSIQTTHLKTSLMQVVSYFPAVYKRSIANKKRARVTYEYSYLIINFADLISRV